MTAQMHPPLGTFLQDGHVLFAHTGLNDGGNGDRPHGVGIFLAPTGAHHAYVVWTTYVRDETHWVESGDYVYDLAEAIDCYADRGGILDGGTVEIVAGVQQ